MAEKEEPVDLELQRGLSAEVSTIDGLGFTDFVPEGKNVYVKDAMTYHTNFLKGWHVFYVLSNTIWVQRALWQMMGRLLLVTLTVGFGSFMFMPDASHVDASRFREITAVLNIFLGLMLSFFLRESVARWVKCVDGFLGLFNAIRNLAMQLHALGVNKEQANTCLRYGVMSAVILINDLKRMGLKAEESSAKEDAMWAKLSSLPQTRENQFYAVSIKEQELLKGTNDTPGQLWTWIGSLIGRLALDGDVPPMASPTYGRLINLCQIAQDEIRIIRAAMFVKTPFLYVHTLATLVHVTNFLFAVALGFVLGTSLEGIVKYAESYWYPEGYTDAKLKRPNEEGQTIIIELLKCVLAPMLYQAFFMLGCSVSSPFANADSCIPVNRMLSHLRDDLLDAEVLANNPPHWEAPSFKK
jgi:predicted membrane chloride channel (bestrophin family)